MMSRVSRHELLFSAAGLSFWAAELSFYVMGIRLSF